MADWFWFWCGGSFCGGVIVATWFWVIVTARMRERLAILIAAVEGFKQQQFEDDLQAFAESFTSPVPTTDGETESGSDES